MRRLWIAFWGVLLGALVLGGTGCTSTKIDWNARVGTYSYDDAVREMGPPDKSAKLTDNSTVADWMTGRGMQTATTYGGGWGRHGRYGYGYGGPGVVVVDQPTPDRFLRLTFDPQGKLASWQRVYK